MSGVVVCDHDLLGVIRVSDSVGLRLDSVGKGAIGADHVNVRSAIRQGFRQQAFDELGEAAGSRGSYTSRRLAASNQDEVGPEVLHYVDVLLVDLGTVKSRRQALEIDGFGVNFLFLLRLRQCGKHAGAQQRQKDAGQDDDQAERDADVEEC